MTFVPPDPPRPVDRTPDRGEAGERLSRRAARLHALLRERGTMTNREWADEAGISTRSGLRDFDELMGRGLVERLGKRRAASYRLR